MQITIELSDDQVRQMESAFRRRRLESMDETLGALAQMAADAWVEWLSGNKRYSSLTEQYADWAEDISVSLLPEDEAPSADRLYNSFSIPYGQAQYIARLLNNKTLTQWRQRAMEQLKDRMGEKLGEADDILRGGDATVDIEVIMGKLAYLELRAIYERLFEEDPDTFGLYSARSRGNLYSVAIPVTCYRQVYEAVEAS